MDLQAVIILKTSDHFQRIGPDRVDPGMGIDTEPVFLEPPWDSGEKGKGGYHHDPIDMCGFPCHAIARHERPRDGGVG
ncbi:MAG TPA: hypothetical protein DIT99_08220 [Candidatus Latescibacteria bacterium]|nr:hypothetical protein [Candidatus Latescibacterota bacterium]